MRRDLGIHIQKRKKIEEEENAKRQLANTVTETGLPPIKADPNPLTTDAPTPATANGVSENTTEQVSKAASKTEPAIKPNGDIKTEAMDLSDGLDDSNKEVAPATEVTTQQPVDIDTTAQLVPDADDGPDTGGLRDLDFDSMFEDLPAAGASPAADGLNMMQSNQGDMDDLLSGLETYANMDDITGDPNNADSNPINIDDFDFVNVANDGGEATADTTADATAQSGMDVTGDAEQGGDQMEIGGDSFDDLFSFDLGGSGDGGMGGDVTDFDKELFGLE